MGALFHLLLRGGWDPRVCEWKETVQASRVFQPSILSAVNQRKGFPLPLLSSSFSLLATRSHSTVMLPTNSWAILLPVLPLAGEMNAVHKLLHQDDFPPRQAALPTGSYTHTAGAGMTGTALCLFRWGNFLFASTDLELTM